MMKKGFCLILSIMCVVLVSAALASNWTLPANLVKIEEEAFMNDMAMNGLVEIPSGVTEIGQNAFSGTNVFALDVPAGVQTMGTQSLNNAVYVRLRGDTQVQGLSGVGFVIGQSENQAGNGPGQNGIVFVSENDVLAHEAFLYQRTDDELTLLSAKDGTAVPSSVKIPATIDGVPVTGIGEYAFSGCDNVKSIEIPESLRAEAEAAIAEQCPEAEVTRYEAFRIRNISMNRKQGALNETVTWTVTTTDDSQADKYSYTLKRNGSAIDTVKNSSKKTYTATISQTGEYQLEVTVRSNSGEAANGSSQIYIAEETMKMVCPETLQNGNNLEIVVKNVTGATQYTVYITEEESGKWVATRTLKKSGTVSVPGYLLDAGTYRVSGYVYGNGFRYSIPTVRLVRVTGTKPTAPMVEMVSTENYSDFCEATFSIQGDQFDDVAVHELLGNNENQYSIGKIREYNFGFNQPGTLSFSVLKDGKWSAWCEPIILTVPERPQLATPEVTMGTEWREGEDIWLTIGDIPHADEIRIRAYPGDATAEDYIYYEDANIYYKDVRKGGTYTLEGSGIQLPAGQYTMAVFAWAETGYRSSETKTLFTITENNERPNKPVVSAARTEVGIGSSIRISVPLDGADAVYPKVSATRPNGRIVYWDYSIISPDYDEDEYVFGDNHWEDNLGYVFHYSFAVRKDGIWSLLSDPVDITITERESLPEAVIHTPEEPKAGQNLSVQFEAVENATNYEVSLWRGGTCIDEESFREPEEVVFDGKKISKGTYQVKVEAMDETDEYSSSSAVATIVVTGERPEAPEVTVDKDTIKTGDQLEFSIDSDGADSLYILVREYDTEGRRHYYDDFTINVWDTNTVWTNYPYSNSETAYLIYSFYSFADDCWSEPAEVRVNVENAEDRILDTPVWTMETEFDAGQDVTVSYDPVENAEYYDVYIKNAAGIQVYRWYESETNPITVEGYRLTAGTYSVEIVAFASGYQSSSSKTTFRVTGSRETAPEVMADSETVCAGRNLRFTIGTTGAQKAVVRYYALGENYSDFEQFDVTGEDTIWRKHIYEEVTPGTRYGYAFCVKKEGKWTAWSSTKIITVVDQEPLEEPEITFGTAEAGKDLKITIGESEHATDYNVEVYLDGNYSYEYYLSQSGVISIPGYRIDGGTVCLVRVSVSDSMGEYARTTTEDSITATGSRSGAPQAQVSAQSVMTSEYFTFTIDTTGAEMIAMNYGTSSLNNYGTMETFTSETTWRMYQYSAGEYRYRFSLLKDGVWTAWSSPVEVTVNQGEALTAPVFEIESGSVAGEDLVVNMEAVPNATQYWISVRNRYGNEIYSSSRNTADSFTVPGHRLSTGEYTVVIRAYANGYISSESQKAIVISGTREEAPSAVAKGYEITRGKSILFTIDTTDVQDAAVRYYTLGSSDYSISSITVNGSESSWSKSVYYDTEIGTRYGFMFSVKKNGRWTAWSQVQVVTVVAQENLTAPDISFGDAVAGQDLVVNIGNSAGATYYEVRIWQDDRYSWQYGFAQSRNITIPGYRIDGGSTYKVQVTVSDSTGEYAEAVSEATVTADGNRTGAPDAEASASEVLMDEYFTFTIDTTGAEQVAVNYGTTLGSYRVFEVFDSETQWRTYSYSAGEQLFRFALLKNGIWTAWSEPISVTVNQGTVLQAPVIHLESGTEAGKDLIFTVDEVEHASSYYLELYNAYQNQVYGSSIDKGTRTLTVPGYRLTSGDYTVTIRANGSLGYYSSSSSESFRITGQKPEAPQVEMTGTEPSDSWSSRWTVSFAPDVENAEKLVCRKWIQGSTQLDYQLFSDVDLSQVTITQWVEDRKIYCYSFSAYENGKWSAWSTALKTTLPADDDGN